MNGINVVPGYGTPPASVRRTIPVHVAPPQATAAAALRRRFDEQDSDSATYVAHSTVPQEVYDQERYFATCDSIQSKIRFSVDRIRTIVRWTESNGAHPRDILHEYEDRVWPTLVEADAEVRGLAHDVRQAIDSCSIGEPRLEWLLAVNKFQVQVDQMTSRLIGEVHEDLDHVLNLRERCATIYGLHLKQQTVEVVEDMHHQLKSRLLQL